MYTTAYQGSATIYEFPNAQRRAVIAARDRAVGSVDLRSPRTCDAVFGNCWYHEAAIRESEEKAKS